jgi:hypothetical protein
MGYLFLGSITNVFRDLIIIYGNDCTANYNSGGLNNILVLIILKQLVTEVLSAYSNSNVLINVISV